jgi:hypothetical protein
LRWQQQEQTEQPLSEEGLPEQAEEQPPTERETQPLDLFIPVPYPGVQDLQLNLCISRQEEVGICN